MSAHDGGEFGPGYWEDRYRSGSGASRRDPSPSLLAEAGDLPPGIALDAGCGWGADSMWLASRGWTVTALDVSPAAVDQARQAAEATDPKAGPAGGAVRPARLLGRPRRDAAGRRPRRHPRTARPRPRS